MRRRTRATLSTIPQFIANAILRCLEKDPTKRFQSIEELQDVIVHEPPPPKILSGVGEDPLWRVWGLACAALAVIVAVVVLLGRGPANEQVVEAGPPSDAEFAAFHIAEMLDTRQAWNAFLKDYQKGKLALVASDRLKRVELQEESQRAAEQKP